MNRHFKPLVKWWNDPYNNTKGGELTLNLFKVPDLLLPLENYTLSVQPVAVNCVQQIQAWIAMPEFSFKG